MYGSDQSASLEPNGFTFLISTINKMLLSFGDKEKKYDPSSELTYNPVENFDTQILPILKGDDDQAKKNLFINIKKGFETINVKLKLNKLKKLLIDCIKKNKII